MKKHLLTSSCSNRNIIRLRNNAFTLIELLAIIVILAIIAVITVPIILNIIENSRMGAATDSAYGYKDAVDKWFVSELFDSKNLKLDGDYIVEDGKLKGANLSDLGVEIPLDGTVPTSGTLKYDNSVFKNGCIVVGDYAVTFNADGTTSTEKGVCPPSVPTIASCPGCKFIYTTSTLIIGTSEMPSTATDDYTTLIGTGGHPYFLGLIESTTTSGKIGRAFACGVEDGTPFCLEGFDTSKWSDDYNVGVLNTIFSGCNASASDSYADCDGPGVGAYANSYGDVYVDDDDGTCTVSYDGRVDCHE